MTQYNIIYRENKEYKTKNLNEDEIISWAKSFFSDAEKDSWIDKTLNDFDSSASFLEGKISGFEMIEDCDEYTDELFLTRKQQLGL